MRQSEKQGRILNVRCAASRRLREGVTDLRTDGPTDGPTDGSTDEPSYRDATAHLKSEANTIKLPRLSYKYEWLRSYRIVKSRNEHLITFSNVHKKFGTYRDWWQQILYLLSIPVFLFRSTFSVAWRFPRRSIRAYSLSSPRIWNGEGYSFSKRRNEWYVIGPKAHLFLLLPSTPLTSNDDDDDDDDDDGDEDDDDDDDEGNSRY